MESEPTLEEKKKAIREITILGIVGIIILIIVFLVWKFKPFG